MNSANSRRRIAKVAQSVPNQPQDELPNSAVHKL